MGAVKGTRREYLWKVAAVVSMEMFARATAGRFLTRTMCDLSHAGVAQNGDVALEGAGAPSLGGRCWRGRVEVVDLGVGSDGLIGEREAVFTQVGEYCMVSYTDRSQNEDRCVGRCWCDS